MAKIQIPRSLLRKLYVKEKSTAAEIARRLNCSEQTVRRRLAEYNITIRQRGPQPTARVSRQWSDKLAYVIGLVTADGNLSPDGRHITFVSADLELHETYKQCLGISNKTGRHGSAFHTTFGDVVFYRWLLGIGLMPKKTFRVKKVDVPDKYFADFARGFLDGDGSITVYLDKYNVRKHQKKKYAYWRLYVRLHSGNRPLLEWMQDKIKELLSIKGTIVASGSIWAIQYAKRESLRFLSWVYYHRNAPCLERKRAKYHDYLTKMDQ